MQNLQSCRSCIIATDRQSPHVNQSWLGGLVISRVIGQLYGERGLVEVEQDRRGHVVMGGHATDGR